MSAIARVMLEMGYKVTGSDVARSALSEKLTVNKVHRFVSVMMPCICKGLRSLYILRRLSRIMSNLRQLEKLNIPVLHRAQMLARLMNAGNSGIAVAGAHGKTTTSSMIALVMETAKLDPTYIIGGEIVNVGTNAKAGKGEYVVAEADESDGSFLHYHPTIAVVTNIEADHLENYDGDFENIKKAYVQFLKQVTADGKVIVCFDDHNVRELLPRVYGDHTLREQQLITYSINNQADYTASNIIEGDRTVSFELSHHGTSLGQFVLSVPGIHNVYNAIATIITCLEAGVELEALRKAITLFVGAKRRFQVMADVRDMLVVDDYAHHPTEIMATINASKATGKRITVVFQPQRFTRTFFLLDEFSKAFPEADAVIITDIYSPAGEEAIEGVSSQKLVELIKASGQHNVQYIATNEEVLEQLKTSIQSGDMVITMGAGDIGKCLMRLVNT